MEESGPLGGPHRWHSLDPPMDFSYISKILYVPLYPPLSSDFSGENVKKDHSGPEEESHDSSACRLDPVTGVAAKPCHPPKLLWRLIGPRQTHSLGNRKNYGIPKFQLFVHFSIYLNQNK